VVQVYRVYYKKTKQPLAIASSDVFDNAFAESATVQARSLISAAAEIFGGRA
jgi:hypothetical protein